MLEPELAQAWEPEPEPEPESVPVRAWVLAPVLGWALGSEWELVPACESGSEPVRVTDSG